MPRMARECDSISFRFPGGISEKQLAEIVRRFEETTFEETPETATYDGCPAINCRATREERAPVLEAIERVFPRHSYTWTIESSVRPTTLGDEAVPIGPRGIKVARKIDQRVKTGFAFQATVRIEPIQP